MLKVTKAVFPVAGLGSSRQRRRAQEMLPVVDKPLIQYAVEEAINAGITEMIFVTGRSKRAIEDHFDKSYEIEAELEARQGKAARTRARHQAEPRQLLLRAPAEALGLGHAVLCAEKLVHGEPFAVILADDLLHGEQPVLKQLVDVFDHYHSSVIGVETIARDDSRSYGVVEGREWEEDIIKLSGIIEKPAPEDAPSNLGVVGRYVFMPTIFDHLRKLKPGAGGGCN
ncbi:UTP--glucose-1-phosphate uridylyltransferase [Burkholderia cepacia]|nr:UTP--glucose-1-phosphate uridylyltransferase [Burkholderia cepacia]